MALPTQIYTLIIGANASARLMVAGTLFKLLSATGTVRVDGDFGSVSPIRAGQGLQDSKFSELLFTDSSGAQNTITVAVGDKNFIDTRVTGEVTFAPLGATFANAAAVVTNASAALSAANPLRKYLMIQNNDAAGNIYVRLDGGVATVGTGVKISALGGLLELSLVVPSGAITAIGDIANNPNILLVQS